MLENMIRVLDALTADEVRGDLYLFETLYGGKKIVDTLKCNEFKGFSFWDNGQTILIYDGRKIVFECNYEYVYGLKRLTTCYDKNGLFHEFVNY